MAEETLQLTLTPIADPTQAPWFNFTGSGQQGNWTKLSWSIPVNLRGDYLLYLKYVAFDINDNLYTENTPLMVSIDSPQLNLKYGGGSHLLRPTFFISRGTGSNSNVVVQPIKFETTINGYIDIEIKAGFPDCQLTPVNFHNGILQFTIFKNDNTDRDMVPNFMKFQNQ